MTAAQPCVVTLGVFDGVHRGHQALLARAREVADRRGQPLVALTFDPHPATVLRPESVPPLLLSMQRRVEILGACGADVVDTIAFDTATSLMSPEEFAREYFASRYEASAVLVGENFRFGRDASGDVARLAQIGRELGFDGIGVTLAHDDTAWSSTRARAAVAVGDIASAHDVLGRDPEVDGVVVHGDHRGRTLGYPTANVVPDPGRAVPADAVFAGYLICGVEHLPAAISIGSNPQFDGEGRRVEAYVLDRDDLDLYGMRVRLEFAARLRDQAVFPSLEDYLAQMARDVDHTRGALTRAREQGEPRAW